MRVAIAGAHGQIAQRLALKLVAEGHSVLGLIRNAEHAWEIKELGADPSLCDLETAELDRVAEALAGVDAAVFAAGAGPGSSAERKWTVDRDGALKLLEACRRAHVPRYVIVSAVGAEDPPAGEEIFSVYLRAKAEADRAVAASDRAWTILRPGHLSNDPGTGRVRIQREPFRGEITRDDVAAVILAILEQPDSAGEVLYLNAGEEPIAAALERTLAGEAGTEGPPA